MISEDGELEKLLEPLMSKYNLKKRTCIICKHGQSDAVQHIRAAVTLCKMAGKRCQRLRFGAENNDCLGYRLKFEERHLKQTFEIQSYLQLKDMINTICYRPNGDISQEEMFKSFNT